MTESVELSATPNAAPYDIGPTELKRLGLDSAAQSQHVSSDGAA